MDAICKMSKKHTTWPCSARACPLFGDCYIEYEKAIQKHQTNADRIRAMSDEELAEWLYKFFWGRRKDITPFNIEKWLLNPADKDRSE